MAELRPLVEAMVVGLLDDIRGETVIDAAYSFAEMVPIRLMSHLFGVTSTEQGRQFRHWVDGILKDGLLDIEAAREANRSLLSYFSSELEARRQDPAAAGKRDLITWVLEATITDDDGTTRELTERERIGCLYVLMLGGIDTTWSLIGASLAHLATHPDDLARLVAEPELLPTAIEEFLRFFTPATAGRIATADAEISGCPIQAGKRMLVSYPSANRDRERFPDPDTVIIDRQQNRHLAFGVGVHRCIGSNLARMETEVALRGWLSRFPRFELAVDPSDIHWSIGAVRGPYTVPLRILEERPGA